MTDIPPPHLGSHDVVPPEMLARMHALVGSVPGCRIEGFGDDAIAIEGWAPSLHKATIHLEGNWAAHPKRTMHSLEKVVGIQRRRAASGLAHGIALPLRASMPPTRFDPDASIITTRHLWIDRSSIEAVILAPPEGDETATRRVLRHFIRPLSAMLTTDMGAGERIWRGGITVTDHDGRHRVELTRTLDAIGVSLAPASLVFTGELPVTTATALVGRPLETLIDLGPAFTGRVVHSVDANVGHSVVRLEPDEVRLDAVYARHGIDLP